MIERRGKKGEDKKERIERRGKKGGIFEGRTLGLNVQGEIHGAGWVEG